MPSPVETTLIVFTGPKGGGKSTAAERLKQKYGFTEINFADKLKEICSVMFDVHVEQFYDSGLKNELLPGSTLTMRKAMTYVGDTCRSINPYFFVAAWSKRVQQCSNNKIVVSDLRLPNEYQIISMFPKKKIIRINPHPSNVLYLPPPINHDTEMYWNQFAVTHEVSNSGTLSELYRQVDAAVCEDQE